MNTLACKTCGKIVQRNSGSQKYCASCSPDSYRVGRPLKPILCKKCGEKTPRSNNGQIYCINCSKHSRAAIEKRKKSYPDLICCHCGKAYGKGRHNASKYTCKKEPCPKCEKIVKRKRAAKDRRYAKQRKREMSRFGKWLLILEEEACKKNKAEGDYYKDKLWTRRRYVSQAELEEIGERRRFYDSRFYGREITKRERPYDGWWKISKDTGGWDGYVIGPGYYRVELLKPIGSELWWETCGFRCVCATGIPYNWNNNTLERIDRRIKERRRAGEEKAWAAECAKRERLQYVKIARTEWEKMRSDKASLQFFNALAMAGAVTR